MIFAKMNFMTIFKWLQNKDQILGKKNEFQHNRHTQYFENEGYQMYLNQRKILLLCEET